MTFEDLDLIEPICKALVQEGYTTPTPIQSEAIPIVSQGYDLLGCAQTGKMCIRDRVCQAYAAGMEIALAGIVR